MPAIAYMNWGRWVADCPAGGCTNARELQPGQQTFTCTGAASSACGATVPIKWPADPAQDAADLAGMPPAQQSQPFPSQEEA